MGLIFPAALAALPLLGVIVALYLLRFRRPTAPVGSLHLWQTLTRDREANSLWQKLRVSTLLLLQLLFLALLIVALSRPWLARSGPPSPDAVIVIDISASMGSQDGGNAYGRTRLQEAQAQARSIVDNLDGMANATLIASDVHASIVVPATTDKARLRGALDKLTPGATETDITEALRLAAAVSAQRLGTIVYLISDGAFPPSGAQNARFAGELRFIGVGRGDPNQGITALSVQRDAGQPRLFVQVANSDQQPVSRRIDLSVDDEAWEARTMLIEPGATAELLVEDVPLDARVIGAELSGTDALPLDDRAWVVNRASVPANVLLVTEGNKFLELALSLLPTVILYKVSPHDYSSEVLLNGAAADVTIFDGKLPATTTTSLPPGNILFFGPTASNELIQVQGVITAPVLTPLRSEGRQTTDVSGGDTHPLLRFVDLSTVHVAQASALAPPPWARVLVDSDKGPLMVAGETEGRKVAVIGFDLRDSDMPVQAATPLLLRNLINFLSPDPSGGLPSAIAPGTSVAVTPEGDRVDRVLIEDPRAEEFSFALQGRSGRITFPDTGMIGVYYVTQYAGQEIVSQEAFAANLFSLDESLARPNPEPTLPQARPASPRTVGEPGWRETERQEVWPWLAGLGFLVLSLEWLYSHRIGLRRAAIEWQSRRVVRET